jgi:xanthine dehydrogenase accessory factor
MWCGHGQPDELIEFFCHSFSEKSMGNLLKTFNFLEESLRLNLPCMLLQVVESKGSSPGRGGFCMAVNQAGEMAGSIGGGMMEHKLVEMAKAYLREKKERPLILPQIHSKQAERHQSGMICSGEQTVLLYHVKPGDLPAVQEIITSERSHKPRLFSIHPDGIFIHESSIDEFLWWHTSDSDWEYRRMAGEKTILHIVGGGHCALALSRLMKMLDFRINLYETRPDINTLRQNEFADEIHILPDYSLLGERLQSAADDLVVVMTFGYRTDDEAIRSIREMPFRWLGLLGSKSKIARMMEDYRKEGYSEKWLQAISAPVGMNIKSQTPEEIAVSIAAEIIQRCNN